MKLEGLKKLALGGPADAFFRTLDEHTLQSRDFTEIVALSALRKRAQARGMTRASAAPGPRVAVVGGASLYPLRELLVHFLDAFGVGGELFVGEYDSYVAEIRDAEGALYAFRPDVLLLLPAAARGAYTGDLGAGRAEVEAAARDVATELLGLAAEFHARTGGEVVLCNFVLPPRRDLGELRARLPGSTWTFKKWVNLELGLNAPPFVRICDLEFLAYRLGGLTAESSRAWFESKQPGSPELLVELCREAARLVQQTRTPPRKVLVVDLDNTLWGGVVAEDGIEGIELGDTSPRGEAFKAFQAYVASLQRRGVLLAVASKNDHAVAERALATHPEMVLRPEHFVAFEANWEPKSDNLRRIAENLKLGLESFVFVDDNPAEIEIVRQFAPSVATVLLDGDPAGFVGLLADSGYFEPRSITREDAERTAQYRAEGARQQALAGAADMASYLASLEMEALVLPFAEPDAPRLAQLINKSNQFNLTTRRRTEAEVRALIRDERYLGLSLRLRDKFGDHGLVSVVIGKLAGASIELDTWLMSCRVLKREVERALLNELVQQARERGCRALLGVYRETPKNDMVRDFYPRMGFEPRGPGKDGLEYELDVRAYDPPRIPIAVRHHA